MRIKTFFAQFRSFVIQMLPLKLKIWLKSLISLKHLRIFHLSKRKEKICASKTRYPGLGTFELPFTYAYFDWYYLDCELNSKRWVFENVQDSWTVIDVGANVGVYSILFGHIAKNGRVFSLEPTETFDLLQQNLARHNLTNVKGFQLGLSDQTGSFPEKVYRIWGKPSESATYSLSTLDDFVQGLDLESLDLIKIDTDGFELDILKGAALTLERYNPWLMIEFSYALNTRGHEVGHLLERLVELGYKEALLLDGNNLVLRKSNEILDNWSTNIKITPHSYPTSSLMEVSGEKLREELDRKIKHVGVDEFFSTLFQKDTNLNDVIFPRLPGRGARMEVNDAPVLALIYKCMNAKNHLEFGTWEGFGASLFCSNSSGRVTTINLPLGESNPSDPNSPVYSSSLYPVRRKQFTGQNISERSDSDLSIGWIYKQLGFQSRVNQIFGNSLNLSAKDFTEKFDSVLIDGAHDRETVIHDTKLALKVLSNDGIIVWHDFLPSKHNRDENSSTRGVFEAISACIEDLLKEGISLYWIQNTWLLVGKRTY